MTTDNPPQLHIWCLAFPTEAGGFPYSRKPFGCTYRTVAEARDALRHLRESHEMAAGLRIWRLTLADAVMEDE